MYDTHLDNINNTVKKSVYTIDVQDKSSITIETFNTSTGYCINQILFGDD